MSQENCKPRLANIELLRIISMLMILTLHYLGQGNVLENIHFGSVNYFIAWALETLCLVSVNCYVLISGYFLVKSQFKLKKLALLWFQILFYSIVIYFILVIIGAASFDIKSLVYTFFPIITRRWWFATCYIALYVLVPFLNIAIKAMSKTQMQTLILILAVMFCIPYDAFNAAGGYSFIWFVFLYFTAAYIRLYKPSFSHLKSKASNLIIYFIFIFVMLLLKFVKAYLSIRLKGNEIMPFLFYSYNSIFILIASIMLFVFFLKVNIKNEKICRSINVVASLAFGVFLIHSHFALRDKLWIYLGSQNYISSPIMVLHLISCVVLVFTVCAIIEYLRKLLFKKAKIDLLIGHIVKSISTKLKNIAYRNDWMWD